MRDNSDTRHSQGVELMPNFAYLLNKTSMNYEALMDLPYAIFLGLLKQFRLMDIQSTEEGRALLKKSEILNTKEADISSVRQLNAYQKR